MPMQCNAMLRYVKKENNVVLLTCIFPFPITRDHMIYFYKKNYVSSFRTNINRDYGLPLLNFSGFSLE